MSDAFACSPRRHRGLLDERDGVDPGGKALGAVASQTLRQLGKLACPRQSCVTHCCEASVSNDVAPSAPALPCQQHTRLLRSEPPLA